MNIKKYKEKDFLNKRFSRLLVVSISEPDKYKKTKFLCKCDCGKTSSVLANQLLNKNTKSCGCLREERKKNYYDISGGWWTRLEREAKLRNFAFEISKKDVWDLLIKQNNKCKLSGLKIKFYKDINKPSLQTASVDRIDSSKGYTKDNIQIIHKMINVMKMHFSEKEFLSMCNLIAKFNKINKKECINNLKDFKLCNKKQKSLKY